MYINLKVSKKKESSRKVSRSFWRKKQWYGCERYKNLLQCEKQELVEYEKKIIKHGKMKKVCK